MKLSALFVGMMPLLLCVACRDNSFRIEGSLEGDAPELPLVLERAGFDGRWVAIDSVKAGSDGNFSLKADAPDAPDIYRLRLGDDFVYFPVDSTETITLRSSTARFGQDFTLSGSANAEALAGFEREVHRFAPVAQIPDSAAAFKRRIYSRYLQDARASVVSYYILTKTIDGRPVFNPTDDYRYFAAVATSFRQFKPSDPRTAMLERAAERGLSESRRARGASRQVEANEVSIIDISLPDTGGTVRNLSEAVGHGTPTLLVFSDLSDAGAPAVNLELRRIRESRPGLNIYQVAFDQDRHEWLQAAANLPWTVVYAGDPVKGPEVALAYNLSEIPVFFIIDSYGNLAERVDDLRALPAALSKY